MIIFLILFLFLFNVIKIKMENIYKQKIIIKVFKNW